MLPNRLGAPSEPRKVRSCRQTLFRQVQRLAGFHDRNGRPDAPISIPCSFVELCKLSLPAGPQPRTFLFGQHVVKGMW